jgi:hypothetical protein
LVSEVGVIDDNLAVAAQKALTLDREKCRSFATQYSWENSARQFVNNIVAANTQTVRTHGIACQA